MESTKPAPAKKKIVLVVKRKRKRAAVGVARGIPSSRLSAPNQAAVAIEESPTADKQPAQLDQEFFGDDDDDNNNHDSTLSGAELCDTYQVIQSLCSTQAPEKCLSIPLGSDNHILTILECSLLNSGLVHNTVSRELAELQQGNHLRKLSPPKNRSFANSDSESIPPPTVFCTVADYCRGVQYAQTCHSAAASEPSSSAQQLTQEQKDATVDWFLQNLKHWTGERIAESDLERVWNQTTKNRVLKGRVSLDAVLTYLVEIQVLLPSHHENAYQLWLPTWPLILQTWSKKRTSLMAQLKRSQYKERSLLSFTKSQASCPIPIPLIVEHLVALDKVELVEKPSGKFVKLVH